MIHDFIVINPLGKIEVHRSSYKSFQALITLADALKRKFNAHASQTKDIVEQDLYDLQNGVYIPNISVKLDIETIDIDTTYTNRKLYYGTTKCSSKSFEHGEIIITPKKKSGIKSKIYRLLTGWTVHEEIGMAVINPRAISKLRLNEGNKDV